MATQHQYLEKPRVCTPQKNQQGDSLFLRFSAADTRTRDQSVPTYAQSTLSKLLEEIKQKELSRSQLIDRLIALTNRLNSSMDPAIRLESLVEGLRPYARRSVTIENASPAAVSANNIADFLSSKTGVRLPVDIRRIAQQNRPDLWITLPSGNYFVVQLYLFTRRARAVRLYLTDRSPDQNPSYRGPSDNRQLFYSTDEPLIQKFESWYTQKQAAST